ncbi:YbaB/EbfC family nucleoid-associated protein [Amycolatopsis sp. K13G38]|uniref:YbaB/EbfC family nucleoid-associated protein n=1 Tax=Amycolatopsis acididurans TaxID=2724524 RepID=A0ABX1J9B8_9PSEU|nr:YbaB/EbfC family nucleoid-associated protein [Amycolatopsis acididurans]NKQ56376.1 YbaB/EbfC family nucleoid-associated protein [Amycolatopsis acididurans]
MSAEFDQLVAQFEQFQSRLKRVDEQFANIGQMQQELAEMEAVAVSPDRSVTVVAGPSGAIKDIRLTDLAMRQSPQALSSALMNTVRQAVAEAARRQAGIVENAVGDDMHLTDQVLETQAQLFGTTPEELRATMEQQDDQPPSAPPPMAPPPAGPGPHPPMPPAGGPRPPMPPAPSSGPVRRPAPPRRPTQEEPDDFSQENFLRGDQRPTAPPPRPQQQRRDEGNYLNLYNDEDQ